MIHKFYIFGAHSRAQTAAFYIQYLYPGAKVEAYLVNNDEPNSARIDGVPVVKLEENTKLYCDYPVILGIRSIYHAAIQIELQKLGMRKIYPVTVELDLRLRNAYLKGYFSDMGRQFAKINNMDTLGEACNPVSRKIQSCIYVAKSIFDKPLQKEEALADYEKIIQVGAALTEERLEEHGVIDSSGDNISGRNRQFCELTGLYWIWKHADEDIVGLVHYRRHFLLPENWEERMQRFGIDVILPVPLYVTPSVEGNYRERHVSGDWDIMLDCLKQQSPSWFQRAKEVFAENLYCPCNMFIMKREVLDALCAWMFPIIGSVAAQQGTRTDVYQNRYPGFLSERLMTLFFEMNREQYKIVYADKNFLS